MAIRQLRLGQQLGVLVWIRILVEWLGRDIRHVDYGLRCSNITSYLCQSRYGRITMQLVCLVIPPHVSAASGLSYERGIGLLGRRCRSSC